MAEKPSPLPQRNTSCSPTGTLVTEEALPKLYNVLYGMLGTWEFFAEQIGVPTKKVSEIKAANPPDGSKWLFTCLKQALEWWVNNHPKPTYEVIIAVLDPTRGETTATMNRTLAKRVREFIAKERVGVPSTTATLSYVGHPSGGPVEPRREKQVTATYSAPDHKGSERMVPHPSEQGRKLTIEQTAVSRDTVITIPCLGRPFQLGMLYDCHNDRLIPGITLWNYEQTSSSNPLATSDFDVIDEDSIDKKFVIFGIDTNLKMSFFAGLVDVSGAAKYLHDKISSKNQARVSLKYQSTSRFEQLQLENLDSRTILDQSATHVVTGILYGADAIFVFDQEVSHNEHILAVHENMKKMIKIPSAIDSSEADELKREMKKIHCKFHGDLRLPKLPSTFEDAMKLYRNLPNHPSLGDCPKKVWLYSLSELDRNAAQIVQNISPVLISQTQHFMEDLHELEIQSHDLIRSEVYTSFPDIKEQVSRFKKIIAEHRGYFAKNLAALLPQIRAGKKNEIELAEMFKANGKSPFSSQNLSSWIDGKKQEVNLLEICLKIMQGIQFAISSSDLNSVIYNPNYSCVVCFTFKIAGRHNAYLDLMSSYFYSHETSQEIPNQIPWYENSSLINDVQAQAKRFKCFAEVNEGNKEVKFVVANSTDAGCDKVAVVELYEDRTKKVFEPPSQPGKPSASSVTHNTIQLTWSKPEYGGQYVDFYTVFYRDCNSEWIGTRTETANEYITVKDLAAQTAYSFKVHAECSAGISLPGNISDLIHTQPSPVPPGKPNISSVTHNSLQLKWSKPQYYGEQDVEFYTVLYRAITAPETQWMTLKTKGATESAMVNSLTAQTRYSLKVQAQYKANKSLISDISEPIETNPVPLPPGKPIVLNVTHNSIQLKWAKPKCGEQSVKFYTIFYHTTKDSQPQWIQVEPETTEESVTVYGLAPQTLHSFKVQAEFRNGTKVVSDVSDPIQTNPSLQAPSKPYAVNVTHNSLELMWSKAHYGSQNVEFYTVFYHEVKHPPDSKHVQWVETARSAKESIKLTGFSGQTAYSFKISAEFKDGLNLVSAVSDPIQTKPSPIAPGKPTASRLTHNSVHLEWSQPHYDGHTFEYYTVCYRETKNPKQEWQEIKLHGPLDEESVSVVNLAPQTGYYFKIRAKFEYDPNLDSDISDPIHTNPAPVIPGKPHPFSVTHNSIQLQWHKPEYGADKIETYTIFYREIKDPPEKWKSKKSKEEDFTVSSLNAKKKYCFKIRADIRPSPDVFSEFSATSEYIETKDRIALQMLSQNPTICKDRPLKFHKLEMDVVVEDKTRMIRKCNIRNYPFSSQPKEKVLMVVGVTGAGKSTLINFMINYILGVEWKDEFRFQLITDEGPHSQSKSQTKWITSYTFPKMEGSPVPYILTIIDTPGFGDTEGVERDKFITSQIKDFFSKSPSDGGIDHINAIGFVTQSALARLTPIQRYIFDSILSIFGKDIAENIFMMVTFADGRHPPVMTAIKDANFPCFTFYKFNNSALFASNEVDETDEDDHFDKMFWIMGLSSFRKFFTKFDEAKPKSLQLTREVLDVRERLEAIVNSLQPQIRRRLAQIEEMRQEEMVLQRYEAEIAANKNFTYEVDITKQRKVSFEGKGIFVTNCLRCNFTCHDKCDVSKDEKKYGCWAMNGGGMQQAYCRICPRKCFWREHVNNPYRFVVYEEKQTRTVADLKKKYDEAVSGRTQHENMMAGMDKQLQAMHAHVLADIEQVHQCLQRLNEIALKPNPLTEVGHLNLMIESEKQQALPGWFNRVQYLEEAKIQATLLKQIKEDGTMKATRELPQEHIAESWYARFKYWLIK